MAVGRNRLRTGVPGLVNAPVTSVTGSRSSRRACTLESAPERPAAVRLARIADTSDAVHAGGAKFRC